MKAVIFDLDNTLFDHTGSAAAAVRTWLPELGADPTDELVAAWFAIEERAYARWLSGELTHQGQRRARLHEFLPLLNHPVPPTDQAQDDFFEGYLTHYRANWSAYPDAEPALKLAQSNNWRIGILTNGTTAQQTAKLETIGLAPYLDAICTTESLGLSKPHPDAYLRTCAALTTAPTETLMIGDNLALDVQAPQAAGLTARHLNRPTNTLLDLL
ncbi:HAD family hydrolase [Kribbella sandramycini]|uniref:HAD family hydrolase n=1 Tax=Kribbella sandramycini TaxID=60450 RepID=A0A7Y4L196_9ACTN|nr:HAD family hydrolase [Kribbella sandramycini]MBB6564796.1 putative hydrolase of the HAD superfamily [Kribbella sandramycini]NOL42495.1 HAD family hydrolase [Kribbella sandramycini]